MTEATRPTTITCARCGEDKPVGTRGPIPTYCSGGCRAAVKYERTLVDGRYETELAAARERPGSDGKPTPARALTAPPP